MPKDELNVVKPALKQHIILTKNERGCLSFIVEQDEDNPLKFWVEELFVDQHAFDEHQKRVKASSWGELTQNVARHYNIQRVGT